VNAFLLTGHESCRGNSKIKKSKIKNDLSSPAPMKRLLIVLLLAASALSQQARKTIDLPSSKKLIVPAPGNPQPVESFPTAAVLSPDGKYLALLNSGFGTMAGNLRQGITIIDTATNQSQFFPDDRLGKQAAQTYFIGLAFSSDGEHLYASIGSLTDPLARKKGSVGNGIAVYKFGNGTVTPDRFISIPPQPIAAGKKRARELKAAPAGTAPPLPAGLAVLKQQGGVDHLLIADNLSDDVLLLDTADGKILQRFDLSAGQWVPSQYPFQVVVNKEGTRAWISLWNASQVVELDIAKGTVARRVALRPANFPPERSSHPTAMVLSSDGRKLYVAMANTDEVAVVNTAAGTAGPFFSTRLPGQKYFGSVPVALAFAPDGRHLFVANASNDTVAVVDTRGGSKPKSLANAVTPPPQPICDPGGCPPAVNQAANSARAGAELLGHIPTEWYPSALVVQGDDLFIVSGKSQGTGPNNMDINHFDKRSFAYIEWLLHGSVARVNIPATLKDLPALTKEAVESNLMNGRFDAIPFKSGRNPIKHVLYIIRENRTYDQIFGDMPVGDNDKSLVMYGADVTPNAHALAAQFGLLDNFYDSGEVSGDGHVWSNAAISSDYTEHTIQLSYRGKERSYDYEGTVAGERPLDQGIPDINEPGGGYVWQNAARHGLTHRNYGEFVPTTWCRAMADTTPTESPAWSEEAKCERRVIKKGEALPNFLGDPKGGPSPWPWDIPVPAYNSPTKPELRNNFNPRYPWFNLLYPDQFRADIFLEDFAHWVADRKAGRDIMPNLMTMSLSDDHTNGTTAQGPRPRASVADNDLALGRIVEAISNSPYWEDTAILVLEDDAQNGADHVDAHRSTALVISKYAPVLNHQITQSPDHSIFVDHHFYTTVNLIHTIEVLLGLPPMNNNDAHAAVMAPLFSGDGKQSSFKATYVNRDNGMIYEMNPPKAPGAAASAKMDFSKPDAAPAEALNRILWRDAKGNVPYPKPKHTVIPAALHNEKDNDDR
jgi:DNA-binding beta-propeller fold protein YncE